MNEVSKGYQSTGQGVGGSAVRASDPLLDAHVRDRLLSTASENVRKSNPCSTSDESGYNADWIALQREQERTQVLVKELAELLQPFISEETPGIPHADIDTDSTVPVLRAIRTARAMQSDINYVLHVLQARVPR